MCWLPWWPYLAEILHNSSNISKPIFSTPSCRFAYSWRHREIEPTHPCRQSYLQSPETSIQLITIHAYQSNIDSIDFLFAFRIYTIRTFLTASFFFSFLSLFNSDFNSKISPFLVVVKYFESVILFSLLLCAKVSIL